VFGSSGYRVAFAFQNLGGLRRLPQAQLGHHILAMPFEGRVGHLEAPFLDHEMKAGALAGLEGLTKLVLELLGSLANLGVVLLGDFTDLVGALHD